MNKGRYIFYKKYSGVTLYYLKYNFEKNKYISLYLIWIGITKNSTEIKKDLKKNQAFRKNQE